MPTETSAQLGQKVYLVDGARTPFLRVEGKPGPLSAADLAVQCGRPLLARQPFHPDQLDEVIVGCVAPSHDEANIARVISLRLGCGHQVPAWSVQRNCASGMQSIDSGRQAIASGQADLILAGGTEAMSHYPLIFNQALTRWFAAWSSAKRWQVKGRLLTQLRPLHLQPIIALVRGLTDPTVGLSMGQTAEQLAWQFGISRHQMDEFALASHRRLEVAAEQGFPGEIEPVITSDGTLYEHDNGLRSDSSLEKLARLKPVFDRKVGAVTAGNSAQITDGAAMVLLASESAVEKYHLTPVARLIDCEWSALDPTIMGLGPVHAMAALLLRNRLDVGDIDYWEINEAFAAQVLACLKAWQDDDYMRSTLGVERGFAAIPEDRLNAEG
ncbi:MAG: acetyl-CoA C-acetyltransferase, partial [Chromatiales bacterium]|nr:acetyl-CoA C-acetyltransferase [Chromatiales bacterium]